MKKVVKLCLGAAMMLPVPALAQVEAGAQARVDAEVPQSAYAVDEIVVTGSRLREESVQDTPIAVAVFSGAQIEALNGSNLIALSGNVPNLTVSSLGTAPANPVISLRGFLTQAADISIEPGVPVYIDGVYQPIISGSMSDLFDVERIEVLRGPQGTTLGKNASAGAVLVTRSRPTGDFNGRFNVEYGSYNLFQAQGLVNFPIAEGVLAGKLYANYRRRDDWVKNLEVPGGDMGGEERGSVRGALLFTPNPDFTYYLTADYIWDRSSQMGGRAVSLPRDRICVVYGECTQDFRYGTTRSGNTIKPTVDDINVTGVGDWAVGAVKISSITGYRSFDEFNANDFDKTPFPALELYRADTTLEMFSQELRLTSQPGAGLDFGGRLAWLVAGYYNHSDAYQNNGQNVFGNQLMVAQRSVRDTFALFGRVDFDLTDKLTVSGGVRHSWDKTVHYFAPAQPGTIPPDPVNREEGKWENTSIEAGAQYKFDPTKMVYLRYAEGYRGGGFLGTPSSVATARSYRPETSRSYEAGLKSEWLDRAVQFNLTLFRTEFTDLQKQVGRTGIGGTLVQVIDNAADATTQGVEVEVVLRPMDGLNVAITGSYLDAGFDNYLSQNAAGDPIDLSGLPFQFAPKYVLAFAPTYDWYLSEGGMGFERVRLGARLKFTDDYEISSAVPPSPVGHQPAFGTIDLSADLITANGLTLGVYANNLLDERFLVYGNEPSNLIGFQVDDIGRVFGVKLGARF
jgi:iron complex outermembrane receptor protein